MRILNLIQCANLGGMEQASLRLMRGLKERGKNVHLLSLNPIGQLRPLLEKSGIPFEGLPYRGKGGWRSYGLVRRKLMEIPADGLIMTGHHFLATLALGQSCAGRRVLAIHYHHTGVKPRWQWQLIYRAACQRFDVITFPCDFVREEAEAIFPPLKPLAHTVRNPMEVAPVPTMAERAEARGLLGLPISNPIIGNAGWLIPRKRFDVFLRTARLILARQPDAVFVVAGNGPERAGLEKLAEELGITASVRWLGWQQEMKPFYQALDVLLFNSDWDAMGLTPLEAMSYGVPVVSSVQNGGLSEVISSNRFGFLLPVHDLEAMAEQALNLLMHQAEARSLGLAGRMQVETLSRPTEIVEWYEQAFAGKYSRSSAGQASAH